MLVTILTGLKGCGKTSVIEHVFKESVNPKGKQKKLSQVGEYNTEGISWYEVAVAGDSQKMPTFDWSFFTRSSGYLHCFISALLQHADKNKLSLQTEQPPTNAKFFDDSTLNDHFHTILDGLHAYFSEHQHEDDNRKYLAGLSLVNVWDVEGANAAVRLVLSMLAGKLKRSFVILGLNLVEQVREANVADFTELLKFAYLTNDKDEERKEACLVAGLLPSTQSEMLTEEEQTELKLQLKALVTPNAEMLGLEKCVSEDPQILNAKKPNEIKQLLEMQVLKLKSTESIPLSWILLRSAFFKSGVLFVEKKHLQKVSQKLGIENFEKFLATFTAMGSVIYNPQIPALEQYVILNPVDFCYRLNSLFNARFDGDLEKGVVPMSYLRRIFGGDADFFRDVLVSSKHAIKLDVKKIKYVDGESSQPPYQDRHCFFIPIICKEDMEVEKHDRSLFLQVKSTFLPNNVGQILVQRLLLDVSVSLIPTKHPKIVCFEYKAKNGQDFVNFKVIYHADACEIRLEPSDGCNPEVVKAVKYLSIDSCRSIQKTTEKSDFVPFGTEVQGIGVKCITSGGYHPFITGEPCQECAGAVQDWQPLYAEVCEFDFTFPYNSYFHLMFIYPKIIDENDEIAELFQKHRKYALLTCSFD